MSCQLVEGGVAARLGVASYRLVVRPAPPPRRRVVADASTQLAFGFAATLKGAEDFSGAD